MFVPFTSGGFASRKVGEVGKRAVWPFDSEKRAAGKDTKECPS
jgi:hypothetical protein